MEYLSAVISDLGLMTAPTCSLTTLRTGQSCGSTLASDTHSAAKVSADLFDIFSNADSVKLEAPSSSDVSVQCDVVLVDAACGSDCSPTYCGESVQTDSFANVDACVGSDLVLFQVYEPPKCVEKSTITDSPGDSFDVSSQTDIPVFPQDVVISMLDSKVEVINDQLRLVSEEFSKYQAEFSKVVLSGEDTASKLAELEAMALRCHDAISIYDAPRVDADIDGFITKKKKGKR
eukprot:TRINITY_DN5214_c0_g3_i5.p1 TRINITY_DN5214_c0_g3~~TRINITY_DN5214_c0_g3_i5.p1  ORF type:complete len:233 (+),score=42.59 TRINITY_DN5214_c0_g3_i5:487-1185(+)